MAATMGVSALPPLNMAVIGSLAAGLQDIWVTRLTCTVALTLLIYDISTTMDLEAHLVWRSRWSFTKIMFIINRYMTPAWLIAMLYATHKYSPSDNFCTIAEKFAFVGTVLLLGVQSAVYLNRVYAIYERAIRTLYLVSAVYALIIIPSSVVATIMIINSPPHQDLFQEGLLSLPSELNGLNRGCHSTVSSNFQYMFIAALLNDAIPFAAIAWKHFSDAGHDDIFHFLFYEETVYLLIAAPVLISGLVCSCLGPIGYAVIRSGYTLACKSILTSRMLLRLKLYLLQGPAGRSRKASFGSFGVTTEIKFASMRTSSLSTLETIHNGDQDLDVETGTLPDEMEMHSVPRRHRSQELADWDERDVAQPTDVEGMSSDSVLCLHPDKAATTASTSMETLSGPSECEGMRIES